MKFKFFERFFLQEKASSENAGEQKREQNPEFAANPEAVSIIQKLTEFRDNLQTGLNEQTADDYVKYFMQLEGMWLSPKQAKEIKLIHLGILEELRTSQRLKEFTGGLAKRGRINKLSQAIETIFKKAD